VVSLPDLDCILCVLCCFILLCYGTFCLLLYYFLCYCILSLCYCIIFCVTVFFLYVTVLFSVLLYYFSVLLYYFSVLLYSSVLLCCSLLFILLCSSSCYVSVLDCIYCTLTLPPGVNPIAVNKYLSTYRN
jgi:hypothetical protein